MKDYISSAFKLFRNYNGQKGIFGDISVAASASDAAAGSVYASVESGNDARLHLILINKKTEAVTANVTLNSSNSYTTGEVWGFDSSSTTIRRMNDAAVSRNVINYTLPATSAVHIILGGSGTSCTDTSWSPEPATVCSGQTFTQTSNCGRTRTATGTKVCTTNEAIIVDHTTTDLSQIPSQYIAQAKNLLRLSYGHTSHGSQIVSGIEVIK